MVLSIVVWATGLLVVFIMDVGADLFLVIFVTCGDADMLLVILSLSVFLNGLMISGADSGRSCIIVVL